MQPALIVLFDSVDPPSTINNDSINFSNLIVISVCEFEGTIIILMCSKNFQLENQNNVQNLESVKISENILGKLVSNTRPVVLSVRVNDSSPSNFSVVYSRILCSALLHFDPLIKGSTIRVIFVSQHCRLNYCTS